MPFLKIKYFHTCFVSMKDGPSNVNLSHNNTYHYFKIIYDLTMNTDDMSLGKLRVIKLLAHVFLLYTSFEI